MSTARLAETAARIRTEGLPSPILFPVMKREAPWQPGPPPAASNPRREQPEPITTSAPPLPALVPIPRQAEGDGHLVKLWLHGRPQSTLLTYSRHFEGFLAFLIGKPLQSVTLSDLQDFADTLSHLAPSSQVTTLSVVKSLFSFGHKLGYLPFNVASVLEMPRVTDALHERYLTEEEVQRILVRETDPRDHAILMLLYLAGLRAAELAGLKWRDLQEKGDSGLMVVHGKRNKTRSVLLPASVWQEVTALRGDAGRDDPVFPSDRPDRSVRRGGHLSTKQLWNIVRDAAERASLGVNVSPHWLRHAHISHALDRNVPIHLVQATVGHSNMATTGRYAHARPDQSSALYLAATPGEEGASPTASRPIVTHYHASEREIVLPPTAPLNPDTLRWTRERLGLSINTLAERLGLECSTIHGYEEGALRLRSRPASLLRDWLESVHAGQEAVPPPPVVDGVALRRTRALANITQQELAAQLGIDDNTISHIETGKHLPSPRVAALLQAWLDEASKTAAIDAAALRETRLAESISTADLEALIGYALAGTG